MNVVVMRVVVVVRRVEVRLVVMKEGRKGGVMRVGRKGVVMREELRR